MRTGRVLIPRRRRLASWGDWCNKKYKAREHFQNNCISFREQVRSEVRIRGLGKIETVKKSSVTTCIWVFFSCLTLYGELTFRYIDILIRVSSILQYGKAYH